MNTDTIIIWGTIQIDGASHRAYRDARGVVLYARDGRVRRASAAACATFIVGAQR